MGGGGLATPTHGAPRAVHGFVFGNTHMSGRHGEAKQTPSCQSGTHLYQADIQMNPKGALGVAFLLAQREDV